MRFAFEALVLAMVFVVASGSTTPFDWAIGCLLGAAVTVCAGRRTVEPWTLRRALGLPAFALGVVRELGRGSWDVFWALVRKRGFSHVGYIDVPIRDRTNRGVDVSAFVATASPGSVLCEVDERRRSMRLNVLDARDPRRVRRDARRFYEQAQREVLP